MKPRLFLWTFGLVAVLLVVSCAPAATTPESAPVVFPPSETATVVPATEAQIIAPSANVPTVLPIATSRGPNLEATDPTTVQLANGGIQLVEFFRFT